MTKFIGDGYGEYDEKSFLSKIKTQAAKIGLKLVYNALELYYVTKNPDCPWKIKACIYSALAYLVSPLDLIPDAIPVVGYSDDAGVIAFALVVAQIFIDEEVERKAYARLVTIFGEELAAKVKK